MSSLPTAHNLPRQRAGLRPPMMKIFALNFCEDDKREFSRLFYRSSIGSHSKNRSSSTQRNTMTVARPDTDVIETEETPSSNLTIEAPSGFILKLFQMVNGAPDEVISVSSQQVIAVL